MASKRTKEKINIDILNLFNKQVQEQNNMISQLESELIDIIVLIDSMRFKFDMSSGDSSGSFESNSKSERDHDDGVTFDSNDDDKVIDAIWKNQFVSIDDEYIHKLMGIFVYVFTQSRGGNGQFKTNYLSEFMHVLHMLVPTVRPFLQMTDDEINALNESLPLNERCFIRKEMSAFDIICLF